MKAAAAARSAKLIASHWPRSATAWAAAWCAAWLCQRCSTNSPAAASRAINATPAAAVQANEIRRLPNLSMRPILSRGRRAASFTFVFVLSCGIFFPP